jgi:hypothetical protein
MTAWLGPRFEPWCLHHTVSRAQTPIGLLALIAPEWGFSGFLRVSDLVSVSDERPFRAPVSAQEIPVPGAQRRLVR